MSAPEVTASPIESDRWRVATLAGVGGFVDAAGFLVIVGLFTAHMSGNSTGLGVALATGHWGEAIRRGFVIPVYVLATVAGVAWIDCRSGAGPAPKRRNQSIAGVLGAEILMLVLFMAVVGRSRTPIELATDPAGFFLSASVATLAMGFQNAALRRVPSTAIHTTFVTGMLTELAVSTVHWILHSRQRRAVEALRARDAAVISGIVWLSYLLGALAGAALVFRFGVWPLLIPILALTAMVPALLLADRNQNIDPPKP